MRLPFRILVVRNREERPPVHPGRCAARTGIGIFCDKQALPEKTLCSFHESLAGPWSKPHRVFGNPDTPR